MPAPPLTHHDILVLVEPFARGGRHLDMAASKRIERQLVFKPVVHADNSTSAGTLHEALTLDDLGTGTLKLTRVLTRGDGLQATLQAMGGNGAELLARIESVDLQQHFRSGAGFAVARSYEFDTAGAKAPSLVLKSGEVRLDGLTLKVEVPAMRSLPADIQLTAPTAGRPALPEDLLAVIGWDWTRLVAKADGWSSKLRLRGSRLRRGLTAERALEAAGAHLARVLAEPPAQFHDRFLWPRWGAVLRRAIPTLTILAMIGGALMLTRISTTPREPGIWLMLHYASIGLLAFSFCLQELPRFEIPPLPRRSREPAWRPAPAAPTQQGEACSATR